MMCFVKDQNCAFAACGFVSLEMPFAMPSAVRSMYKLLPVAARLAGHESGLRKNIVD
jgi:hypothetical protein